MMMHSNDVQRWNKVPIMRTFKATFAVYNIWNKQALSALYCWYMYWNVTSFWNHLALDCLLRVIVCIKHTLHRICTHNKESICKSAIVYMWLWSNTFFCQKLFKMYCCSFYGTTLWFYMDQQSDMYVLHDVKH